MPVTPLSPTEKFTCLALSDDAGGGTHTEHIRYTITGSTLYCHLAVGSSELSVGGYFSFGGSVSILRYVLCTQPFEMLLMRAYALHSCGGGLVRYVVVGSKRSAAWRGPLPPPATHTGKLGRETVDRSLSTVSERENAPVLCADGGGGGTSVFDAFARDTFTYVLAAAAIFLCTVTGRTTPLAMIICVSLYEGTGTHYSRTPIRGLRNKTRGPYAKTGSCYVVHRPHDWALVLPYVHCSPILCAQVGGCY